MFNWFKKKKKEVATGRVSIWNKFWDQYDFETGFIVTGPNKVKTITCLCGRILVCEGDAFQDETTSQLKENEGEI